MMFEACSVAVFGWQRVSTAFRGANTRHRLLVRHGWNVSGVNTGCPGSIVRAVRYGVGQRPFTLFATLITYKTGIAAPHPTAIHLRQFINNIR